MRGIEEDARAEAEKILSGASLAAGNRRQAAGRQAAEILGEARRKAQEQVEAIRRGGASTITVQTRRLALRLREEVIREILAQTSARLSRLADEPDYRPVLLDWIAEAAIGLNVPEAVVAVSERERKWLDAKLLREAEEKVRALTGQAVRLELSDQPALALQGVLLTSRDGRVAYNNQVPTRMLRSQPAIRRIIHDELFGEEGIE